MSATSHCPSCGAQGAPGSLCPKDKTKLPFPRLATGFAAGEYVGLEKIGEGGMGEVWRGEQPQIQKKVALKILNEKILHDTDNVMRFQREAIAVNRIQSKHIVDIFSFGKLPDGRPYFVMELLSGKSLRAYLEEVGPLPYREILFLLEQLCKGLQAAHDAGIIHRDLKPDNIFLVQEKEERDFIKILDFGIAKLTDNSDQPNLTGDASTFGTPTYISPEQAKGAGSVDQCADIYSLGIILYEMITGRTPFYENGDPAIKVMLRHVSQTPPAPSQMVVGRLVPASVDQFVLRVLAKKREERPQSCREFLEKLRLAIGDAKSSSIDILHDASPVWISDFAKRKHELRQAAPKQAAETKKATPPNLEQPQKTTHTGISIENLLPTNSHSPLWWIGAASIVALSALLLFSSREASPEAPRSTTSAQAPQTVKPEEIPSSAPTTPSTAPVTMKSQAESAATSQAQPSPAKEALQTKSNKKPVEKTTNTQQSDPTTETKITPEEKTPTKTEPPKETANPFEHKGSDQTANPFGQKQ